MEIPINNLAVKRNIITLKFLKTMVNAGSSKQFNFGDNYLSSIEMLFNSFEAGNEMYRALGHLCAHIS